MVAKLLNTFVEMLNRMRNLILVWLLILLSYGSFSQESINKLDAKGMKTGKWTSRYPGGKLRYEGYFDQNKPVGSWKRYHENGKIKAEMKYRPNSERVVAALYDEEGKLYAKGIFEGTLRDSTWNFFGGDQLFMTENYQLGKKEGKATGYYQNGKIMWEKWWKQDLSNGNAIEFNPTGVVIREIFYKEGKKDGPAIFYDDNGAKTMEGSYKDDLSDGVWKIFEKDGKVKYQITYEKGEILNNGALDELQMKEFKEYDKVKGKIPEPKAVETGMP